eukprot:TCALIF_11231-PA protein Name:"Similar to Abhd14b Alpha/beta hydrolase domain-containing protein 14B (Mus musculus)" AED:0.10 eAED:0.10 QI:0/0.8/0.66/0.83/0.8/0.66/6/141/260
MNLKMNSQRQRRVYSALTISFLLFGLVLSAIDWRNQDYLAQDIPQNVLDTVEGAIISESSVKVKGIDVFYRVAEPGKVVDPTGLTLFLLHGAAFTSSTWQNQIDTTQTMSTLGHRVIAVDLPGSGNTASGSIGKREEFLAELIGALSPGQPVVLVSPSYSGSFSLPLLLSNPELLSGYVPVAPGSAFSYKGRLSNVRVPTLIVVGENDGRGSSVILKEIPTSSDLQIIPNAGHPAYLDDPERWHKLLHNFMGLVQSNKRE